MNEKKIPTYQCPLCGRDMTVHQNVGLRSEWFVFCNHCHAGVLIDSVQALVKYMPELLKRINRWITRIEFRDGKIQVEL